MKKVLWSMLPIFFLAMCAGSGNQKVYVTVPKAVGYNWFNRMEEGVKRFAADNPSIKAYQQGPSKFDAALQVQVIEDLIAQKVDVLAVTPFQPETLSPVLKKAADAGIIVVTHEAPGLAVARYDVEPFNNAAYGEHLMEALATQMNGTGEYALFLGSLNSTTHKAWVDSALAYQRREYPNMRWVGDYVESTDDSKVAYEKTKELLKKYPNLKGFQGSSALDVVGIGQAIEELGLSDKTSVVGTSIVSYAGDLLKTGAIDLISGWDPGDSGYAMNVVAKMIIDGVEISDGMDLKVPGYERIVLDGNTIYGMAWIDITKENMDQYNF
ncbi:MAG: autoinducer 2 ABC transporter substrate-binding protein [Brevinema sp.]